MTDLTSSRAVLALDVDGVMSPLTETPGDSWPDWASPDSAGFPLPLSPSMAASLLALPATRVWLTTWEGLANTVVSGFLDWPTLPVLPRPATVAVRGWWKADALVTATADLTCPVVWVDDDIRRHPGLVAKVRTAVGGHRLLTVSPDRSVGITPAHIRRISRFLHDAATTTDATRS